MENVHCHLAPKNNQTCNPVIQSCTFTFPSGLGLQPSPFVFVVTTKHKQTHARAFNTSPQVGLQLLKLNRLIMCWPQPITTDINYCKTANYWLLIITNLIIGVSRIQGKREQGRNRKQERMGTTNGKYLSCQ